MKKLVLLLTGALITLTTVTAAEKITANQGEDLITNRYRNAEPILFVERGVEFLIFFDGSFDFNTNLEYTSDDVYYKKNTRRRGSSINSTHETPGRHITYSSSRPRGVIITHDRNGRVRRIGNVFLNYNYKGQIKRIGSVYISYNRRGLVRQIGGLHIRYNRNGCVIDVYGHVNYRNQGCGFCNTTHCSVNHLNYNNDQHDNGNDPDDGYYFYKNGKKTKRKSNPKKSNL